MSRKSLGENIGYSEGKKKMHACMTQYETIDIVKVGIGSNFSNLLSVIIHGSFSLERVSGVRF